MGTWTVDRTTEPGVLRLKLAGSIEPGAMAKFVEAHNRAITAYGGRDYKVWCDVSELVTLCAESAALFEDAKRFSNDHPNFRGSSVLVASATVAMQHRRTSIESGVIATELISDDVQALRAHLRVVYRVVGKPPVPSADITKARAKLSL